MRLARQEVIKRLKAGQELSDDGTVAKFHDGGHCNVFTFWWLRDRNLITRKVADYPCYWYWNEETANLK